MPPSVLGFHPSHALAPADATTDIRHWRERLLIAILRVEILVGIVPTLLAVSRAMGTGDWRNPIVDAVVIGILVVLERSRSIGHTARAWGMLSLLFAIGLWLLVRVGAVMQMYLLAVPALAVLLLPVRTALALVGVCTVAIVGVGAAVDAPLQLSGYDGRVFMKWTNFGSSFLFVSALITLSGSFLLRRLEHALRQQRSASDSLRRNEETLRQIAAQVPGMVFRLRIGDDGQPQYVYVSPGVRELFGIEPADLMADGSLLRAMWHPEDRPAIEAELRRVREANSQLSMEWRMLLRDGTQKWLHVSSSAVVDSAHGAVRNGIMLDITERKASETLVWRQANFDALTGLPNRRMLRDRLEQSIGRSRRDRQTLALMLIDLDNFKEVNDTLGHDCGDQLLVEAARRIRACVRESDTVARMGGDEFTVVLSGITSHERVELIARHVIDSLGAAFQVGGDRAYVTASIGITLFPGDADQIEGLLKNADQALYAAKDAGRNRFSWFTPEMQEQAQVRSRLAKDLRDALDQGQFSVHYQPIVELGTGRVVKAEALLRWRHPERGLIPPSLFIPIAESNGLIGEIGDWVFRTAATQVARWRATQHPQFQISVNRSPLQFRADGAARTSWGEHLESLGLPGQSIAVEITEGLLLDATDGVSEQLLAMRDAGIPVSLDDFGTGYCSMSYLQKFDIDFLKIDRSFVHALSHGDTGRPLCKAMIVMAHELGMKVIAEGVETAEQRDWLRAAGCDYAQGYLIARPMAVADFEDFLARRRGEDSATMPLVELEAAG